MRFDAILLGIGGSLSYVGAYAFFNPKARLSARSVSLGITAMVILLSFVWDFDYSDTIDSAWINRTLAFIAGVLGAGVLFFDSEPRENGPHIRELSHDTAERIFNSDEFLTTLRSTLPAHADGTEHWQCSLPYVLEAIDQRRQRYRATSDAFLQILLVFIVTFSLATGLLGWIAIDRNAVGSPRQLHSAATSLDNTTRTFQVLLSYDVIEQSLRTSLYSLQELQNSASFSETEWNAEELAGAITYISDILNAIKIGNMDYAASQIGELRKSDLLTDASQDIDFYYYVYSKQQLELTLKEIDSKIQSIRDSEHLFYSGVFVAEVHRSLENTRIALDDAKTALEGPSFKLTDGLNRMFYGLILISFFIAIIRYLASLYRKHHEEMIRADDQDVRLRTFAITMQSANGESDLQRAAVLSHLGSFEADTTRPNDSSESEKLIKDIVEIIAKNVGKSSG